MCFVEELEVVEGAVGHPEFEGQVASRSVHHVFEIETEGPGVVGEAYEAGDVAARVGRVGFLVLVGVCRAAEEEPVVGDVEGVAAAVDGAIRRAPVEARAIDS